ncbi:MAG: hypothetical protein ACE5EW_06885 [Thermoplasmata archaeon]
MRLGMHFAVLLLVVAMFLVTAPASGQLSVERPTYTAGDSWVYELNLLTDLDLPENTTAEFTLTGTSTVTIQRSMMRNIGGAVRDVYEATHVLEASAVGSVSLEFFNTTTNATFTATATVDETAYLDTAGLEVWERQTEFSLNVSADLEVSPGVTVTTSIDANGTVDMVLNYTTNTWGFPLAVGNTGEEAFSANGWSYFEATLLGNTTSMGSALAFNGTSSFEAVREQTITVDAGQFETVVVANTPGTSETPVPTNISTLAYWSSAVGAPVRYTVTNETGEEQVELALTGYRYQAGGLSILGLPAEIAIPILVGIAAVAIILVVVLGRRRRPAMPPPPPPPGP